MIIAPLLPGRPSDNHKFAKELSEPAFAPRPVLSGKDASTLARTLLAMSQSEFSAAFKGSPMKRARLRALTRNSAVGFGNGGSAEDVPSLVAARSQVEPLVRSHAAWALGRIGPGVAGTSALAPRGVLCALSFARRSGLSTDRLTQPPSPSGLLTPCPGPSAASRPRDVVSARPRVRVRRSAAMMMTKGDTAAVGGYGLPTGPPTGPAPVLVIDDDPRGATTTLEWLARAGYPTAAEAVGDSVLRLVRAELMRLVVSELYIPCAEGACIVTALKQDRTRLPRLRVLVHTRHTTAADDAWALAAGCDGVLHKPGSAGALVREVRRLEGTDAREPGSAAGDDPGKPWPTS